MRLPRRLLLCAGLSAALGCGSSGGSDLPPPGDKPLAPGDNDPAYRVDRVRSWYLIGNDLTPGHDQLELQVTAPDGTVYVDAWVADLPGVRLADAGADFRQVVDIATLGSGEHEIVLAADGAATGFARVTFIRSHPLYVVVSNDWDDPDNSATALSLQQELHDTHPELLLTHFVGPYTFTDPEVSEERADFLAQWVLDMRDNYDDEIGLHIHPYCNFVDQVDEILDIDPIPCRTDASTVYSQGDPSGYTIMLSAYTEEEATNLFLAADVLFEENGLGKPTSFRAGGWTADLSTLKALANAGHVADTSANNWSRMEEWEDVRNGVLYDWNRTNWASINDTSQPYYPSVDDILATGDEIIPVLEVPDNGILVDYVTAEEMIEIFNANWSGGPLDQPTAYSIGYHPSNFDYAYRQRIGGALSHADQFLIKYDAGPVVYSRLSDLTKVWKLPE